MPSRVISRHLAHLPCMAGAFECEADQGLVRAQPDRAARRPRAQHVEDAREPGAAPEAQQGGAANGQAAQ